MIFLVGVLIVGGGPGVAYAFQLAFVTSSPADAVVTAGATGSVAIELGDGDGNSSTAPIAGLRPDDEVPDDDHPIDAFAERDLTIRNVASVPSSLRLTVEDAPGTEALEGLRVAVTRIDPGGAVVVSDTGLPVTSALDHVAAGDVVTLRFRFRLAHDAPPVAVGRDSAVRVTVDAYARAGGNR